MPHFGARRKRVTVVKAAGPKTSQRLPAADIALIAADTAQGPERQPGRARQIPYGGMGGHHRIVTDRPVAARITAGLAVQRLVENAAAAGSTAINDNPHAL